MILPFPNLRPFPASARKSLPPQEARLWKMEESLWSGGLSQARASTAADAVFLLPQDPCPLRGIDIWTVWLDQARWRSVAFLDRSCMRNGDTIALAYRVSADRPGSEIFEALCMSSFHLRDGGWLRVSHQQTPFA
ncbi:hypothetical protein SAMN04488567_2908 [Limimaricola pyoseonensis]|uniref:DUF4440 domain-containing protein n=1 Tax=Limimaricola pyoseonensis TaxID=521013 RepID=A0A1G7GSZ9_9RHOB|nr:hypothetical protein SAMN04488567_2908 [Limimaricola pyoseonensis]